MERIRKRSRTGKQFTTKKGVSRIITIDGPAASGKTSIGYAFSQTIGFNFLDAGMVYRAGCVRLLDLKCPTDDDTFNYEVYRQVVKEIEIVSNKDDQSLILAGVDVTKRLSDAETTKIVSQVGSKPLVRGVVRDFQKEVSTVSDCVFTGRDVGSEVFPNSDLKLFLTASSEVRAERRYQQLLAEGKSPKYEDILAGIVSRDRVDSTRSCSPFRIPEGATIVDTSNLNKEGVIAQLQEIYINRFGIEGNNKRRL